MYTKYKQCTEYKQCIYIVCAINVTYMDIHRPCAVEVLFQVPVHALEGEARVAPQWAPVAYTPRNVLQQVHIHCAPINSYNYDSMLLLNTNMYIYAYLHACTYIAVKNTCFLHNIACICMKLTIHISKDFIETLKT